MVISKSNKLIIDFANIMKKDIHPKYNDKATVICACGNSFTVGSTLDEIKTELCSACHPFYTGKQKLVDTARRVEKFQAKIAGAKKISGTKKGKTAKRAAKATVKAAKTVKITEATASATAKKTVKSAKSAKTAKTAKTTVTTVNKKTVSEKKDEKKKTIKKTDKK